MAADCDFLTFEYDNRKNPTTSAQTYIVVTGTLQDHHLFTFSQG